MNPFFLDGGPALAVTKTEPFPESLEGCALAARPSEDPIYALCAKGPTLTLATAVTLSQGVLSISPVRWKFIEGSWDDTEPLATGDWHAFFLSNLGEASLDVTDIRLTSEAPSDWVLDGQCGSVRHRNLGARQPARGLRSV